MRRERIALAIAAGLLILLGYTYYRSLESANVNRGVYNAPGPVTLPNGTVLPGSLP